MKERVPRDNFTETLLENKKVIRLRRKHFISSTTEARQRHAHKRDRELARV